MSGPLTTLPGVFRPSTGAIPESISAMSTPLPVKPFDHMKRAPVIPAVL